MGMSKMRWPGSSYCDIKRYRMYYSEMPDGERQHGVGLVVCKSIAKNVTNFVPISERIMLIQVETTPVKWNIIQVYAPTTEGDITKVEELYTHK